jgi:UDP-N-acetylmuramyl pentapeptide phosphotransferase/UDP-N-acetylglucosamine-1-phosphate transferase
MLSGATARRDTNRTAAVTMIDGHLLIYLVIAFAATYAATRAATGWVRRYLVNRSVLDHPNARSSHAVPTPRGGGIALVAVLLCAWGHVGLLVPEVAAPLFTVLAAAGVLAAVSWRDDVGGLSPLPRLAVQVAAVAAGLAALPPEPVFQGLLPTWADRVAAGLAWLWFVNLYNFMDGIDGLAGVETAAIGLGVALIAVLGDVGPDVAVYGIALAAAALGFLHWNWQPARIFLGDVGSVPVGFLGGWLLLTLAAAGHWAPALLLPLYYLGDATITLARRLFAGARIWEAHRSHFYQRATTRAGTHAGAVRRVARANVALVLAAAVVARAPGLAAWALIFGVAVVALLLYTFVRRPIPAPRGQG